MADELKLSMRIDPKLDERDVQKVAGKITLDVPLKIDDKSIVAAINNIDKRLTSVGDTLTKTIENSFKRIDTSALTEKVSDSVGKGLAKGDTYNPNKEKLGVAKAQMETFLKSVSDDSLSKKGDSILSEINDTFKAIQNGSIVATDKIRGLINEWRLYKQEVVAKGAYQVAATVDDIQRLRIERNNLDTFMGNVAGNAAGTGNTLLAGADDVMSKFASRAKLSVAEVDALIKKIRQFKAEAKSDGSFVKLADPTDIATSKQQFEELGHTWSQVFAHPELAEKYRSILGRFKDSMPEDEFKALTKEISVFKSEVVAAGANTQTFGDRIKNAFKNLSSLITVTGAIRAVSNAMRLMIENTKELDEVVVDLQIASGKSRDEVKAMVNDYADMGRQLGVSAKEVAQAADTFLRQGLEGADVDTMVELSTRLAKLGKINADEASTALTSAMKGYDVEIGNMERVVDMLTAVDAVSASEAGGLATAMSRTAESAKLAGVEMSTLLGYIAAVKEVTQADDAEVGTFFKTMFARYGNIKAGNLVDPESAESLSDVETVLNSLGIALRSSESEFREFDEVIAEVAMHWDGYSTVQQRAIAQAFGNTRNQEKFLVLMENIRTAMDYAGVAADSAGTSMKKYEAYSSGIEAKQEALTASVQQFASLVADSDVYGALVGGAGSLLGAFNDVIDTLGVVPTVVAPLATIILLLKQYVALKQTAEKSNAWNIIPNKNELDRYALQLSQLTKEEQQLALARSGLSRADKRYVIDLSAQVQQAKLVSREYVDQLATKAGISGVQKTELTFAEQQARIDNQGVLLNKEILKTKLLELATEQKISKESAKQIIDDLDAVKDTSVNPVSALNWKSIGITAGISIVSALIKHLIEIPERIHNAAKEANEALQESNSNIEELQSKIEEIDQKIVDINKLAITDKSELATLEAERAELERQLEIEQALNALRKKEQERQAAKDAKSALIFKDAEIGASNSGNIIYYQNRIESYEKGAEAARKKYEDAVLDGNERQAKRFKKDLDYSTKWVEEYEGKLLELRDNLQETADESGMEYTYGVDLTDDQQEINDFLDKIKGLDDYLADRGKKVASGDKGSIVEIIEKEQYEEQRDYLQGLAAEGKLTESVLNGIKFANLRGELHAVGLDVNDLIQYFSNLQDVALPAGASVYMGRNQAVYGANSYKDAVGDLIKDYQDNGAFTQEGLKAFEEAVPGGSNSLFTGSGDLTSTAQAMVAAVDDAEEAARVFITAQMENALANGDNAGAVKFKQMLEALKPDIVSIFEETSDAADSVLQKLSDGLADSITTSEWEELQKTFPNLTDEILDFANGTKDAAELADDLRKAMDAERYEEFNDALEDVADAVKDYGENSYQVEEALENLESVVPALNDALYDEDGALTSVGKAALVAASGNRQAAIEMLQSRAAALMVDMSNAIAQYSAVGDAALTAAQKIAVLRQIEGDKTELANVNAMITTLKNAPIKKSSGGGGRGGSSKKDVLEAYKADKKILEHRIKMSEDLQDLYEEETDTWKEEQSKQYDIYKEYAGRIQEEMEKLRAKGYDESSEELMELSEDLSSVVKQLYKIEKAIWQAGIDSQVEEIEDQIEAENKRWEEREKQLDAEIDRNETLKSLYETQYDLTSEMRQERLALEKELEASNVQRAAGLTDADLFTASDYALLMSEMDTINAESVALYNDYVAKINSVSVDEAYKLDLITTEYETQYDLLSKKYQISKANLALTKAQIALQDAQDNRKMAVLVGGRWTWVADSDAIESAVDGIYDAEAERAQAEGDYASAQRTAAMEMFIANLEAQKAAEEQAHDALIESLEELIDTLKEMKFAMSDFLQALVDAIAAIQAAAANASSSSGSSGGGGGGGSWTGSYDPANDVRLQEASIDAQNKADESYQKSKAAAKAELDDAKAVLTAAEKQKETVNSNSTYTIEDRAYANARVAEAKSAVMAAEKKYKSFTYSKGGVVDYTGLANVHGAPNAPEVVFNATDAKKLYELVNGNSIDSMITKMAHSLRDNLRGAYVRNHVGNSPTTQYIVNGLTFGEGASGLTLGELARKLTNAVPFA